MFSAKPFLDGSEHLLAELKCLDLLLQRRVLELRALHLLTEDQFRGLYIPDAHVDALLGEDQASAERPSDDLDRITRQFSQAREEVNARIQASLEAGARLPLLELASRFRLSEFDAAVLLIAVAPEVNLRYEALYSYVQNDVTKKRPTVQLAMDLLCPGHEDRLAARAALGPQGALLRHRLVRLYEDPQDREAPFPAHYVKAEARIVDFLLDIASIDARLLPFTERAVAPNRTSDLDLHPELRPQVERITRFLREQGGVICFHGPYGVGKRAASSVVCAELGKPLLVADTAQAAASGTTLASILPLLVREALLQDAGLLLNHFETQLPDDQQDRITQAVLGRELRGINFPVFLASEVPWQPAGEWTELSFFSFEIPLPEFPLRLQHWRQELRKGGHGGTADTNATSLANKFALSGGAIRNAARQARHLHRLRGLNGQPLSIAELEVAARAQSNQNLRRLAQKIETKYTWSDIVIPGRAMQQLESIHAAVRYRHLVYSDWGFDAKLSLGKGLNVLFCGPSGTGKTMAASILARELGLDLYKIDLSTVVSKYIGETEKHLNRIFSEARTSNSILFFDEADALFGKRSEVKDAHDRYANIEVAYLLQKMEEYDGMVVLATNLRKNLDDAFTRRLHYIVEFPFPDAHHRELIWRSIMPQEALLDGNIDFGFLARQFDLAGGNIRNIALAAAFLAAGQHAGSPATNGGKGRITMEHFVVATSRELQKIGKLPSRADFRDYYDLICSSA